MGRNADKKRARRAAAAGHGDVDAGEETSGSVPANRELGPELPDTPHPPHPGPFDAGSELLAGADLAGLDDDGSLARALFRLTCLLSTREARPHGTAPGTLRDTFSRVAAEVAHIVEADTVSLLKLERGDDLLPARLLLLGAHGLALGDSGLVSFDLGDGIAGHVASTGKVLRVEDAPRDPRFTPLYGQRTEIGSLLAAPLMFGGHMVGVLVASRREIRAFSQVDEDRFLLVADSIAQDLEQARLLWDAITDPLTGLASRLALLVALPREVEIARRYRTDLSLVLVDVNGLRAINETKGRAAGDRALVDAAHKLRTSLRAADLTVRLSADQIAVLLPMTSQNNARALAKRLLRMLAADDAAPAPKLSFAIGTATLAPDEEPLSLLWRADDALQAAKGEGPNQIVTAPVPKRRLED